MARWAEGGPVSVFDKLSLEIGQADQAMLESAVAPKIEEAKKGRSVNPAEYRALRTAYTARKKTLAGEDSAPASAPGEAAAAS
jgi:hypothetical protein